MSNIIAIDPGTEQSAIVVIDSQTRSVKMAEIWSNEYVIDWIRRVEEKLEGEHASLAIEMIASYGMAVGREVFETCLWVGRFDEAWERATQHDATADTAALIYRRDVKLHHCGSPRAKDANIRQALIDKYGAPGTKKNPGKTYGLKSHLWAAFAIATYVAETAFPAHNAVAVPRNLSDGCGNGGMAL